MNTFVYNPALDLRLASFGAEFFGEDETAEAEQRLLDTLESLPAGGVVVVDFAQTRLASEAARQLLKRAILRVGTGELDDRFLILDHAERSRYSIDAMLRREGLTTVERTPAGLRLIGKADPVAVDTFEFVAANSEVTAKAALAHFALQNIAAATNRLTALTKAALVRRTGPRPLASGGREYVFAAVR